MFMKSMKISSKADTFPSISQSEVDFEQIYIGFWKACVSGSCQAKNIHVVLAFSRIMTKTLPELDS